MTCTYLFSASILAMLITTGGCKPHHGNVVTIFAAASTAPALEAYANYPETTVPLIAVNAGASSTLAQQILHGAPCDLVLLADMKWMAKLEKAGHIAKGSCVTLLTNSLVVITQKDQKGIWKPEGGHKLQDVFSGRFSIGDPSHVPVGAYAKEALQNLNEWNGLSGRLLKAPDARTALLWVEKREAVAGIVYLSDALSSPRVRIVAHLPAHSHSPIVYTLARCHAANTPGLDAIFQALTGEIGRRHFAQNGLIPTETTPCQFP